MRNQAYFFTDVETIGELKEKTGYAREHGMPMQEYIILKHIILDKEAFNQFTNRLISSAVSLRPFEDDDFFGSIMGVCAAIESECSDEVVLVCPSGHPCLEGVSVAVVSKTSENTDEERLKRVNNEELKEISRQLKALLYKMRSRGLHLDDDNDF